MLTIYNEEEREYQLVEEPDATYTYSYADYLQWKFKERLELIKGHIYKLAAPNTRHQEISGKLYVLLYQFVASHQCRVFSAPFDVRLPRKNKTDDKEITTVVQPDICVVCDAAKIDVRGCCGAPDLVIEVASPGNSAHEMLTKYGIYEEAGVREYWLINPEEEKVTVYLLNNEGHFESGQVYTAEDVLNSAAMQGFGLKVADAFNLKM